MLKLAQLLAQLLGRQAGRFVLTISLALMMFAFEPGKQVAAKELFGAMSPSWSPDGKQIAYAFYQQERPDLYLINVDQRAAIKLAENAVSPAWSPDGKQIAYVASTNGDSEINIVTLATMHQLDLTMGYVAKWSPDGKQIAYGVGNSLGVANADGSVPRHLITDSSLNVFDFAWSPDGKTIAFATYNDDINTQTLYLTAPDGSSQHKVATSADQISFAWSPDGSHLAFAGNCDGGRSAICMMNSDGSNVHILALAEASNIAWSPDGKAIAFGVKGGIAVVNTDGTARRNVTVPQPYIQDSLPLWSPDGSRLLFMRMQLPSTPESAQEPYMLRTQMYIVNTDGSNLQLVID